MITTTREFYKKKYSRNIKSDTREDSV